MKDHLLSWHEKFQPLGPALKTPRIEVDEKSATAEFEERSFDHPSCTGGNAPSLSPQALAPSPAPQVFKVGDRVRGKKLPQHYPDMRIVSIFGDGEHCYCDDADGGRKGMRFSTSGLELLPSQPSDTQQWVEWKTDAPRPVPFGTSVEIRRPNGELWSGEATRPVWPAKTIAAYRVVQ